MTQHDTATHNDSLFDAGEWSLALHDDMRTRDVQQFINLHRLTVRDVAQVITLDYACALGVIPFNPFKCHNHYGVTRIDPDTVRDFSHVESTNQIRFNARNDCDL